MADVLVAVGEITAVLVLVGVGVEVLASVAVLVGVGVDVLTNVAVLVGVAVGEMTSVAVAVGEIVAVSVSVGVGDCAFASCGTQAHKNTAATRTKTCLQRISTFTFYHPFMRLCRINENIDRIPI